MSETKSTKNLEDDEITDDEIKSVIAEAEALNKSSDEAIEKIRSLIYL